MREHDGSSTRAIVARVDSLTSDKQPPLRNRLSRPVRSKRLTGRIHLLESPESEQLLPGKCCNRPYLLLLHASARSITCKNNSHHPRSAAALAGDWRRPAF